MESQLLENTILNYCYLNIIFYDFIVQSKKKLDDIKTNGINNLEEKFKEINNNNKIEYENKLSLLNNNSNKAKIPREKH